MWWDNVRQLQWRCFLIGSDVSWLAQMFPILLFSSKKIVDHHSHLWPIKNWSAFFSNWCFMHNYSSHPTTLVQPQDCPSHTRYHLEQIWLTLGCWAEYELKEISNWFYSEDTWTMYTWYFFVQFLVTRMRVLHIY